MQRYDIITEADARGLEVGTTVALTPGGHVTPLAEDTLRARRITVLRAVPEAALDGLAPADDPRRLVIGSDHTGVSLKAALVAHLRRQGRQVVDVGTDGPEAVDYPDIAARVARMVARNEAEAGVAIDGAGLGSAIAANKVAGVRAAMCCNKTLARYAREHNGANVLALGATLVSVDEAAEILDTFVTTPMRETRYIRRLAKVRALEAGR